MLDVFDLVSIPAGFSDALRHKLKIAVITIAVTFQSLLGFLMRCDLPVKFERCRTYNVSIPAGFSDALRLDLHLSIFSKIVVSIPAGFSDALRLYDIKRWLKQ